ncbi:MAG: hypothetical protein HY727_03650 [Candidatus Rokubacteria bacterium]|nr:hypothetical protein [Candidatus Rokubacteria bacterium]
MTGVRRAILVAMALLLGQPVSPGQAEEPGCRPQGEVQVCQAVGFGTILSQDTAQARDEALIDARRRALEQVAGVQVDAETITRNQVLFDQLVRTQTRGLIQADRVLDEGPTGDGRYRARIEAWVKPGEVQDRLESLLSDLSLVVLLPEQNLGRPQPQPVVENEVVSRLMETGYRVLDHAHVRRVVQRDQEAALLRGDERATREIGLRFLANLIVIGEATTRFSQNNLGIISAHARVTGRVIEAETGRVIANVSLREVRGFAQDQVAAGERALANAARPAAEQLLQTLDAYFKRKERRVEVSLRGLPSLDEYRRARAFLEKQRWVSGVAEGGYSPEASLIVLTYPEKTLYLAARMGREPRYRLLEFDRSRILVEYRP